MVAVLALVLPGPAEEPSSELPGLAEAHGIKLGVAVAVNPLAHDSQYRDLVTDHYTSVTAENTMKWQHVQPERYEFDWSGPDLVVDFAEDNGLSVRGHTLLWHNQQPDWLAQGSFDADELRAVHNARGAVSDVARAVEAYGDPWTEAEAPVPPAQFASALPGRAVVGLRGSFRHLHKVPRTESPAEHRAAVCCRSRPF